jgi:tRNA-dihydrouridine synthase A
MPQITSKTSNGLISIAPMMDWTDRHCRYFFRLLSKNILLYTEMVVAQAIIHGDVNRHLAFHSSEHPIALQLGGSDPHLLAQCAKTAENYEYNEINLNVGCPSDRVQSGKFGACLMLEPQLVADCVKAMQDVVSIPVTVKTRIGVDDQDSYEALINFIQIVALAGCKTFIIHARKAWLKGLSPKENREVPPLSYPTVYQLKKDFPHLNFIMNGGIKTYENIQEHLQKLDGVMIGREAYHNPYLLAGIDREFFNDDHPISTREDIIECLISYIEEQQKQDVAFHHIARHILGLYHGQPHGKAWRRNLSTNMHAHGADVNMLKSLLVARCDCRRIPCECLYKSVYN